MQFKREINQITFKNNKINLCIVCEKTKLMFLYQKIVVNNQEQLINISNAMSLK